MFLDSSMLRPYIESEYVAPLDSYLKGWKDWDQYFDNIKEVGKGDDGQTYGVSLGTDTRGIWYRKDLLAGVGIKGDWQPKTWDELLSVARKVKEKYPNVMPLNLYTGKAQAETGVMQGFEMLLYGTKDGSLYDSSAKKWITGSKQFKDSLNFINTLFKEKLGPTAQQASDAQLGNKVPGEWLPQGKLAMTVDGNWLNSTWQSGGDYEWKDWQKKIGWTGFPTQDGSAAMTTMSGGWVAAMSSKAANKDLAFKVIETMQSKANAKSYYIGQGQIAVRKDIENDKEYLSSSPTTAYFTKIAQYAHFRPMTSKYNEVSSLISVATESVMTGQQSVDQAMSQYDTSLASTVGSGNVIKK
jgi:multiple sugar transport system substrate-binding protein